MQRVGVSILAAAVAATCFSPAFAQRDGRQRDGRHDSRPGDRGGDRPGDRGGNQIRFPAPNRLWDWSRNSNDSPRSRRTYEFGKRVHTRALADELYQQANTICWEMYQYYQRSPGYQATYGDMYGIQQASSRINRLVRDNYQGSGRDDDRLVRELYTIDEIFHRLEGRVDNWQADRRDADRGGQLRGRLKICTETLHHLMEDYGVKPHAYGNNGGGGGGRHEGGRRP